jgi:hypothetical protein
MRLCNPQRDLIHSLVSLSPRGHRCLLQSDSQNSCNLKVIVYPLANNLFLPHGYHLSLF